MLFDTLHSSYNSANDCRTDLTRMKEKIDPLSEQGWNSFSRQELLDTLQSCAKNTAPGPNHITWRLLKQFIKSCLEVGELIINVANASINYGHWPDHFKKSVSVIIPKPGKPSYDKAKSFRPIILLNTMGKLIEKMIAQQLQFEGLESGAIHPCQTGGIMQQSVEDAAVALTHHVRTGWAHKKATSVLAFDIAQFFPSLNHNVLSEIIKHFGFSSKVVSFFSDYLTKRKRKYTIKGEISPFYDSDVGVGQGSVLSPILSALYIAPVFHLLDKWNTDEDESMYHLSLTSFLSFVDDGLLVATGDNVLDIQTSLKEAYAQITSIFTDFGLVMEHTKTELFNFVESACYYNSLNPKLDLGFAPFTGDTPVTPKRIWQYLGIFYDHNLTFCEHVKHYATKSISTVCSMKILGNSSHGLTPKQKRTLYVSCVQPIATYGLCCWYKLGIRGFKMNIKLLNLTHNQGAHWITGAFRTTPVGGMLAVAGLMPLHITLKKQFERSLIHIGMLHTNHPVLSLVERGKSKGLTLHTNSLKSQLARMRKVTKSPLDKVTIHEVLETFHPLSEHVKPGSRFIDLFPDKIDFALPPAGNRKDLVKYHEDLKILPLNDDTIHFITGWSHHKCESDIPLPARCHSHSSFVAIHNGKVISAKIRPAGRRVTEEMVVGWGIFLSLLKAFHKLEKDNSIHKIVLYTTAPKVIRNLLTMNTKPLGSTLSVAVSLAFHDIVTTFPDVEIQVKGFFKAGIVGKTMFNVDQGFQFNATWAFNSAQDARYFRRHGSFPELAPYKLARSEITKSLVLLWQEGFDDKTNKSCYHGHGWLDTYEVTGSNWQRVLPSHLNQGPWLRRYRGVTASNSSSLCGRLVRTITKHAPIGEFHSRFFPDKPPEDLHGAQHAPETRAHILNHCSWYIRRADHYKGGINTIPGLILFLANNPTAFSFDPTEQPRILDCDWQSYRTEIYSTVNEMKPTRSGRRRSFLSKQGPYFTTRQWTISMSRTLCMKGRRCEVGDVISLSHFLFIISFFYLARSLKCKSSFFLSLFVCAPAMFLHSPSQFVGSLSCIVYDLFV
jgi:hypothetical protein